MMDLTFVYGLIAAKEHILTQKEIDGLKELDKNGFLDALYAHQFGLGFQRPFELMMLEEELKLKQFLESVLKDQLLFKVLYIKFNHLFLSGLLKSHHLGVKFNESIEGLSIYPEYLYQQYLIYGIDKGLNIEDKVFIDNLINKTKDLDAQSISDIVINILNQEIIESFDKKTDKYLVKYYKHEIAMQNILLLIRSKRYKLDKSYFVSNLLEGSAIENYRLVEHFDKTLSEIGDYLSFHLEPSIKDVLSKSDSLHFMQDVQFELDKTLSKILNDFTFEQTSYGAIISFVLKKRLEIVQIKKLYYEKV